MMSTSSRSKYSWKLCFVLTFLEIKEWSRRSCVKRMKCSALLLVFRFLGCVYRLGLLCSQVFWGSWAVVSTIADMVVYFSYLLTSMEPLLYAVLEKYWTTNICMDDQCQCFICSYWIYIHIRMFHVSQDESSCTDNNFGFVMDTVDLWNSNVTFALICRGLFFFNPYKLSHQTIGR